MCEGDTGSWQGVMPRSTTDRARAAEERASAVPVMVSTGRDGDFTEAAMVGDSADQTSPVQVLSNPSSAVGSPPQAPALLKPPSPMIVTDDKGSPMIVIDDKGEKPLEKLLCPPPEGVGDGSSVGGVGCTRASVVDPECIIGAVKAQISLIESAICQLRTDVR